MLTIPRSREVGQSYLTSIWTTLISVWAALAIVYMEAPQLARIATHPASMAQNAGVPMRTIDLCLSG